MFCMKCGKQLPDDALFCYKCGYKAIMTDSSDSDENYPSNSIESIWEKNQISFSLNGCDIIVDETAERIGKMFEFYDNLQTEAKNDFVSLYNRAEISCFEDVIDKVPQIIGVVALSVTTKCFTRRIAEYKNFDLSKIDFIDTAVTEYDPTTNLQRYYKVLEDISTQVFDIKNRQYIDRQGGSRWYGGGFGIKNAIIGSFEAGVLNFVTDSVRGIIDKVQDADLQKKVDLALKKAIPQDAITDFLNDVLHYVQGLRTIEIELLIDSDLIEDFRDDVAQEKKRLANLQEAIDSSSENVLDLYEQGIKILLNDIPKHPFVSEYYVYLIEFYSKYYEHRDYEKSMNAIMSEITPIMEYFHVDSTVKNYIEKESRSYLDGALEFFRMIGDPDELNRVEARFIESVMHMSVYDSSIDIQYYKNRIQSLKTQITNIRKRYDIARNAILSIFQEIRNHQNILIAKRASLKPYLREEKTCFYCRQKSIFFTENKPCKKCGAYVSSHHERRGILSKRYYVEDEQCKLCEDGWIEFLKKSRCNIWYRSKINDKGIYLEFVSEKTASDKPIKCLSEQFCIDDSGGNYIIPLQNTEPYIDVKQDGSVYVYKANAKCQFDGLHELINPDGRVEKKIYSAGKVIDNWSEETYIEYLESVIERRTWENFEDPNHIDDCVKKFL